MLRRAVHILLALLVVALIGAALLWLLQDKLIYHPRPLPSGALPAGLEAMPFATAEGGQVAYVRRGRGGAGRLWLLCGGNAAIAIDWAPWLGAFPAADTLLLLDYPGYGACAGHPSPSAIRASVAAAIAATASALRVTPERLTNGFGIVGYSLGSGPATQAAEDFPGCERIILLAPYTSLRAMARRQFGWPLCLLLSHDFDNQARLDAVMGRAAPHPRLAICHGDGDQVIPPAMGRALAERYRGALFFSLRGMSHDDAPAGLADAVAALDAPADGAEAAAR